MGRFKTVPDTTKDDRFAKHVESEFADINRKSNAKGTAVGEGVITSRNMASVKLKDVAIQTTLTKIPHGLGAVPSEYSVIVKKPTITYYKATRQIYNGATTITHGLGSVPKFINIETYNGSVCVGAHIYEDYSTNTEYIKIYGFIASGAFSSLNLICDVYIDGGSKNWIQAQEPDSVYLYLKADDVTLTADIIVKE